MSVAGFDIGSQSTTVAVARKRGIDVLLNKESNRETPALASFTGKNRLLGTDAVGSLTVNPKNTISQLKRLIGKQFRDPAVQEDIAKFPYSVVEAADGGVEVQVQYLNERTSFSPAQLVAMLLVDAREIAQADGSPIVDCVVTVPVFFTDAERHAMLAASKVAGLSCLRLMNETTATALAYGIYKTDLPETDPVTVTFVDMGHSCTQVSVVSFKKGQLQVLAHAWDRNLGGRNFDEVLFEHFVKEFDAKYKLDIKSSPRACFRLRLACEKLKKVLSGNAEAVIHVESLQDDKDASGSMTRELFEQLSGPLIERFSKPLQQAVVDAGITLEQISSVEVVGGSSRIPVIITKLSEVLNKEPSRTLNAKECVARGAALQAAMLSPTFKVRDFEVIDKSSYGIQLSWDKDGSPVEQVIFPRNSSTPSSKVITFNRDSKFALKFSYTADSDLPDGASRDIAEWQIGPPPIPSESSGKKPSLKVKAKLSLHGIVSIESATQIVEEEYEEAVKVNKPQGDVPMQDAAQPEGTEDAAMKDASADGEAASASVQEAAGASDTGAAPMETEEVMQKKIRSIKKSVPVEGKTLSFSDTQIMDLFEKECQLAVQDRLQRETDDKKNELESYIYALRGKLSDTLAAYIPEAAKDVLVSKLTDLEDWLYDEGEDQGKSVYHEKLQGLRTEGDPIETRYIEASVRGPATVQLKATAELYKSQAQSSDERLAHIDTADKQKVIEEADKVLTWLQQKQEMQAQAKPFEDPVLLSSDIKKKEDTLRRVADPILTKPPPVPKEDPKKEAAPPAEPTAHATDAPKPDDSAMPDGDGASVPSKVDIEEVDASAPMEEQ